MPLHSMRKLWHKLRSSCHRKHRKTKALVFSTGFLPPAESVASGPSFDLQPALAYVNTIDATQLSNFLTWILYFETVELPEAPVSWYQYIDPDVRGWVMLGSFLVEHPNHGSELFVLDSICDRLALKRPIVYKYLKKFSSPDRMSWTQIAQVTREGEMAGNSNLKVLELVQSTLHELFDVAEHVQPTVGSMLAQWKDEIITRVRGYLSQVIAPRIAHVRLGKPLLKGSTSENLPKEVKQALRLTYLYETMLLERPVPLARYGILPEAITASMQRRDGYDDVTGVVDVDEDLCRVERSYSSTKLRSQNRDLRATLVHLQKKNGSLVEANEKLARKLATYGRQLPNAYTRPAWGPHETSTFTLASYARAPAPGRSRSSSSSDSAAWQLLPMVSEQPDCAAATSSRQDGDPGLRRHLPDSERGSYEDLFKDLDSQPVLGRPLLHPATGQALSSHTTSSFEGNCPTFRPPRPRCPPPPGPSSSTPSPPTRTPRSPPTQTPPATLPAAPPPPAQTSQPSPPPPQEQPPAPTPTPAASPSAQHPPAQARVPSPPSRAATTPSRKCRPARSTS